MSDTTYVEPIVDRTNAKREAITMAIARSVKRIEALEASTRWPLSRSVP